LPRIRVGAELELLVDVADGIVLLPRLLLVLQAAVLAVHAPRAALEPFPLPADLVPIGVVHADGLVVLPVLLLVIQTAEYAVETALAGEILITLHPAYVASLDISRSLHGIESLARSARSE
jgi:hypothetical protein